MTIAVDLECKATKQTNKHLQLCYFWSDFYEIFHQTAELSNFDVIHYFGNFLLICVGKGPILGPKIGMGKFLRCF